ncbi:GAF domain-containing protein [Stakelama pacifica]|uniref:Regulatory Fis family protein n=1 Tax=Stakelama pacifica TaxID=517720 RepID=A0A4R6FD08_9SPHN|nr:GAF domain-containing protein [Stakelama pacifica]TDN79012.1 regulatory Fis family protein [Stakelama pacifica]GGO98868.1 Fis family transcriptional regulator [Stakelama pacifica]
MDRHHQDQVEEVLGSPTRAAQSLVAASWCRSGLKHGLNAGDHRAPTIVSGSELTVRRQRHELMLDVARPLLDQLFQTVAATGCAVMLSDRDGVILEARSKPGDREMFEQVGLTLGGVWSEGSEGTNGIGTCLVEGCAVTIHRDQHFASRNIGISCMDAPVYDAAGRLTGALDISNCRDDHTEATATLVQKIVQDAARRIERALFCRSFEGNRIIDANLPGGDTALLAVDRDDLIVGATRAARRRFSLTDASLGRRGAAEVLGGPSLDSFRDADGAILRRALAQANGNATQAAKALGIGRATLYRRMDRAGISRG